MLTALFCLNYLALRLVWLFGPYRTIIGSKNESCQLAVRAQQAGAHGDVFYFFVRRILVRVC